MDVDELIAALTKLPAPARKKPAQFVFKTSTGEAKLEIMRVDYDLTTVALRT